MNEEWGFYVSKGTSRHESAFFSIFCKKLKPLLNMTVYLVIDQGRQSNEKTNSVLHADPAYFSFCLFRKKE
jgi:hypothetical protein